MFHCLLFNVAAHIGTSRSAGIYRIAHHLRDNHWDAEVIDFVPNWSLQQLKLLARTRITKNTKFLGFSHLFSTWSDTLEEFCIWIKKVYPSLKLISGSAVNPSFKTTVIDYYIQGFGEIALTELLKYLFSNGSRPRFALNKVNNGYLINANDQYPAFPMKSLMIKYEDRDYIQPEEWLSVEFSRGCKFACDFCNFPVLGVKGDYSRDAEDFYLQLSDAYDRFGVSNYIVADETFNDSTEKITKFANAVEQLPFTPWFSGFVRADLLVSRPADIEEMARMNFLGHYYGVESFNRKSAKMVGKGMDPEKIKDGLLSIKQYYLKNKGMYRGQISLIVGLPYDDKTFILNTQQWLIDNWIDQSVKWFVLHIPNHELDKPSKMSSNYTKYGYSLSTEDKELVPLFESDPMVGATHLKWKNQHMDIFDAFELANKLQLEIQEKFNLNIWSLGSFELTDSIYTRLLLKEFELSNIVKKEIRVRKYIRSKLSH